MKRLVLFAAILIVWAASARTFEIGERDFLLDGRPFTIRCGEMHYARVPRPYWRHRLQMLRAMGCNAVGCYMFWNFHERERGVFTWTNRADAAAFCRLAQAEGLWVILRPGPYSCAEWEGGGAPWWLLDEGKSKSEKVKSDEGEIRMRSSDPRWLGPAKRWIAEVGRQLAPLQITRGGPILMVQVENEYGLHGNDVNYIRAFREATLAADFEVPLYACNPPRVMQNGFVPELFQAANFGGDPEQKFRVVREYQPKGPLMCAEFYPAWFDTWGQAHHPPKSDREFFGPIDWMLEHCASFSLYMAHGGTSFGGWAGCRNPFVPNTTSYDYEAPISEQGRANPSYAKFRERAAAHLNPGETIPDPPALRASDAAFTDLNGKAGLAWLDVTKPDAATAFVRRAKDGHQVVVVQNWTAQPVSFKVNYTVKPEDVLDYLDVPRVDRSVRGALAERPMLSCKAVHSAATPADFALGPYGYAVYRVLPRSAAK